MQSRSRRVKCYWLSKSLTWLFSNWSCVLTCWKSDWSKMPPKYKQEAKMTAIYGSYTSVRGWLQRIPPECKNPRVQLEIRYKYSVLINISFTSWCRLKELAEAETLYLLLNISIFHHHLSHRSSLSEELHVCGQNHPEASVQGLRSHLPPTFWLCDAAAGGGPPQHLLQALHFLCSGEIMIHIC